MTDSQAKSQSETLAELRSRVLSFALGSAAIGVPLLSFIFLLQILMQGRPDTLQVMLILFTWLFPLLWLVRNILSVQAAAAVLIGLMLLMAFLVQLRGGLTASATVLQLTALIMAGIMFNQRSVLLVVLISVAAFAAAAVLVLGDLVPPIELSMWDPNRGNAWLRNGVLFAVFGTLCGITVTYVVQKLELDSQRLRASWRREQHQRIARQLAEEDREAAIRIIEETRRVEALGRMASGIAHDFNNSLTVIITAAEMAQRDPYLSMRSRKYLASIRSSALAAADMTGNLLALSGVENAGAVLVNAGEVLNDLHVPVRRLLPADLEFSFDETTTASIHVDRIELERALLNMIINARDRVQGHGSISAGCRKISVMERPGELKEGSYVLFWIKDNGRGLSQDQVASLMEPSAALPEPTEAGHLGMAQVKAFALASGGKVELDSTVERGTRCYLYIPAAKALSEKATGVKSARVMKPHPATRATMLLVEDNQEVLVATEATLSQAGMDVVTAADSDVALQMLKLADGKFDLMCIDGVIPGVGSAEVIRYAREHFPRISIILCTGYAAEELKVRGINTSELVVVRKPFLIDELMDKIRSQLEVAG